MEYTTTFPLSTLASSTTNLADDGAVEESPKYISDSAYSLLDDKLDASVIGHDEY